MGAVVVRCSVSTRDAAQVWHSCGRRCRSGVVRVCRGLADEGAQAGEGDLAGSFRSTDPKHTVWLMKGLTGQSASALA